MTSSDIELAIVRNMFPPHRFMVLPNVKNGLNLYYEADLLVITNAGYAYEIEIKVSVADAKRDLQKRNYVRTKHETGEPQDKHIKGFYFAYPEPLHECMLEIAPDYAGLIAIQTHSDDATWLTPVLARKAKLRKAVPYGVDDFARAGRLMMMRYWTMRQTFAERTRENAV